MGLPNKINYQFRDIADRRTKWVSEAECGKNDSSCIRVVPRSEKAALKKASGPVNREGKINIEDAVRNGQETARSDLLGVESSRVVCGTTQELRSVPN